MLKKYLNIHQPIKTYAGLFAFLTITGAVSATSNDDLRSIKDGSASNAKEKLPLKEMTGEALPAWRDMESALAWVVGPVDVHVLNHHGFRDSANPFFLSVLEPRIHILSVYAASHPGPDVMRRMLSDAIYPGPRDIFLTNGMWKGRRPHLVDLFGSDEAEWLEQRIGEATASLGHIVIRVEPGGDRYYVYMLDDHDENYLIMSDHGPFESQE